MKAYERMDLQTHILWPLCSLGKISLNRLARRLVGPQVSSARCRENKIILPVPEIAANIIP
jgi:hypothetical protein